MMSHDDDDGDDLDDNDDDDGGDLSVHTILTVSPKFYGSSSEWNVWPQLETSLFISSYYIDRSLS